VQHGARRPEVHQKRLGPVCSLVGTVSASQPCDDMRLLLMPVTCIASTAHTVHQDYGHVVAYVARGVDRWQLRRCDGWCFNGHCGAVGIRRVVMHQDKGSTVLYSPESTVPG